MKVRIFEELEKSQNILIAGAGGGFDIFAGLPLYFWLRNRGKTVHLANLSFTPLGICNGQRPVPHLVRVLPGTSGSSFYFPELHLAQWLADHGDKIPVYAIERTGVRPVLNAYQWLVKNLNIDTLIVVDGGMDSLMRGDEFELGTPQEDMASLAAAHAVTGPVRKLLVCLGFGIDVFHGVCHALVLENIASLIKDGGYLGAWSLTREMDEFRSYQKACEYVFSQMPHHPSIVNSSIISAVNGFFGDHHATERTAGSTLFINPLMGIYWSFHLESVVRHNLYLDLIRDTKGYDDLTMTIDRFRSTLPKAKSWQEIPC